MKLKKLIAAGLMATMPFALAACADDGDPGTDDTLDNGIVDDTGVVGDDTGDTGVVTDTTMADDSMTETTVAGGTTETTG